MTSRNMSLPSTSWRSIRGFVVVRDGGVKSHKQKQPLLLNSMSSMLLIKQNIPKIKLAFSSFVSCDLHGACQLRPLVCIMCAFVSHTKKAKRLASVIPGKPHYSDLLEKNVAQWKIMSACCCCVITVPVVSHRTCRTLTRRTMTWMMRYRTSSGLQSTVKPC